jgi:hypothetical protein
VVMPAAVMHSATVAQSAIVTDCSAIGFVASALVLAAFGMKDMVNLRIVAICSNVAFITYAVMLNLLPILILHVILLPLNAWRLMGALKQRSATTVGQSSVPLRPVADFIASMLRKLRSMGTSTWKRPKALSFRKVPVVVQTPPDLPSLSDDGDGHLVPLKSAFPQTDAGISWLSV